jgi:cytochrome c553
MSHWKRLAAAACLASVVVAVSAAEPVPRWAFPGPENKSIAGSKQAFSWVQMYDRTTAIDWFPNEHPPMPAVVKGHLPVYACGFCHLPQGAGRPENAALAGLPYAYIKQQIDDMKSGARTVVDPTFGPGINMMLTIKQVATADADEAAKYYSQLTYKKRVKIVEADEIPRVSMNAFVYVFDKSGARERLGERIVEGPDDFELLEMRDPRLTMTAYVPVGSIARGAALARGAAANKSGDAARPSCDSCHGVGLKGGPIGPPIAGRPLTATFRQLYAFKIGTRNGAGAALMKPVVGGLSQKEMIDLTAYVGSLNP